MRCMIGETVTLMAVFKPCQAARLYSIPPSHGGEAASKLRWGLEKQMANLLGTNSGTGSLNIRLTGIARRPSATPIPAPGGYQ